jgi:hypothetical protein
VVEDANDGETSESVAVEETSAEGTEVAAAAAEAKPKRSKSEEAVVAEKWYQAVWFKAVLFFSIVPICFLLPFTIEYIVDYTRDYSAFFFFFFFFSIRQRDVNAAKQWTICVLFGWHMVPWWCFFTLRKPNTPMIPFSLNCSLGCSLRSVFMP